MDKYLHDPNAVAKIIGKDAEMPSMIPFYFKITMLRNKDVKTPAFTLYMGQNHAGYMQTLLSEIPFPDVQLVLLSPRCSNPYIFDKQILLHQTLCE